MDSSIKNIKIILKKIFCISLSILCANVVMANDLSDVKFTIEGQDIETERFVVEDREYLKAQDREHTYKYYSYEVDESNNKGNYAYKDVFGIERKMDIDTTVSPNKIVWNKKQTVYDKSTPLNYDMYFGVDVSRHNGNINWKKVKDAGFDFAFVRIAYRGYGKEGKLYRDKKGIDNLRNAKTNGLKVGAYVFSQSINEKEAVEEAEFAIKILEEYKIELDLPLVYDGETIRNDIARSDDIDGAQWTKNALAFCEYVKGKNIKPAIYSNMVWQDYYYDMKKFNDIDIWYADYNPFPQSPYHLEFWQFSESGKVDGITDDNSFVDLNVRFVKK